MTIHYYILKLSNGDVYKYEALLYDVVLNAQYVNIVELFCYYYLK